MSRIANWFDARLDLAGLRRGLLDREVPDRLTWWHTLGSATLTMFVVQVVSGVVLATFYSAAPDHAYDSVMFIQTQVPGGALLRGIHHWAASAMVVLLLAHMVRVFSMGAYKYPREANWLVGVGLFVVVMGFSFTGYLLPWDQKAYWATQVGTSIAGTAPVIGGQLVTLLRGGGEIGAATLSRFYAFHVLWLPGLIVLFIMLHVASVIRQGIAPETRALEDGAPRRTSDPSYPEYYQKAYKATKRGGVRFFPDIIGKDMIVSTLMIALVVLLAATVGSSLEAPADPTDTSYIPTPEWYFLPLYQLLKLVPGSLESLVAVGVPTALLFALIALPFFDRRSMRHLLRRPLALVSLTVVLGGAGWLLGAAVRERGPAVAPEVGRPLNSMERAGRALYGAQKCADCHTIDDQGGDEGPALTEIGLHHSAAWIHSFIERPALFRGDTTDMPAFGPPVLSHQQVEELAQYLTSLRGSTGRAVVPEIHDTFPVAPTGPR